MGTTRPPHTECVQRGSKFRQRLLSALGTKGFLLTLKSFIPWPDVARNIIAARAAQRGNDQHKFRVNEESLLNVHQDSNRRSKWDDLIE